MLTPDKLHGYQQKAVNFQCSMPHSMLWLDMGLGKSAITLTSIVHLLIAGFLRGVVIVAPIRVIRMVWRQEAMKWSHTQHLKFSMLTGTRDQRTRALLRPADVYLVNYENLGWLAETLDTYFISKSRQLPFNGIVWDEISKCFVAGTPITTENSAIAIDKLRIGDMVMTHLGLRRVTDVMTSRVDRLVSVALSNGRTVQCTEDHPFLLNGKWVGAGSLRKGDLLYGAPYSSIRSKIRVEGVVHHEQSGGVDVWNITVEEAETYFAGGVLVHNCKNSSTQRVKSVKKILPHFDWATGLTGTPASNGYKDLHGQYLVVDRGQRLGTSKTAFRTRFYKKEGPYKEVPFEDTEDVIKSLVGDITLEMSAEDYNPLPDLMVNDVEVEMPEALRARYDQMEKDFFLQLDSGQSKEMFNQASLTNACLQFANGAIYPIAGMPLWEALHDLKLDALEELIDEANGEPILCSYAYRSDAERIMTRFKSLDPINLTECKSERALEAAMARWKSGNCRLMIGHAASMGHGVDGLQDRGHILVWFGLTWSLDLYKQFNARLRRQGQGVPVICHRIMMRDTLDQAQSLALAEKDESELSLRSAIKTYRQARNL